MHDMLWGSIDCVYIIIIQISVNAKFTSWTLLVSLMRRRLPLSSLTLLSSPPLTTRPFSDPGSIPLTTRPLSDPGSDLLTTRPLSDPGSGPLTTGPLSDPGSDPLTTRPLGDPGSGPLNGVAVCVCPSSHSTAHMIVMHRYYRL